MTYLEKLGPCTNFLKRREQLVYNGILDATRARFSFRLSAVVHGSARARPDRPAPGASSAHKEPADNRCETFTASRKLAPATHALSQYPHHTDAHRTVVKGRALFLVKSLPLRVHNCCNRAAPQARSRKHPTSPTRVCHNIMLRASRVLAGAGLRARPLIAAATLGVGAVAFGYTSQSSECASWFSSKPKVSAHNTLSWPRHACRLSPHHLFS